MGQNSYLLKWGIAAISYICKSAYILVKGGFQDASSFNLSHWNVLIKYMEHTWYHKYSIQENVECVHFLLENNWIVFFDVIIKLSKPVPENQLLYESETK